MLKTQKHYSRSYMTLDIIRYLNTFILPFTFVTSVEPVHTSWCATDTVPSHNEVRGIAMRERPITFIPRI